MITTLPKKAAYIGAGAGIVLFATFGLVPGSLLGGAVGVKLAGMVLGFPLEPGIISRVVVLCSMLVGVIISGTLIVTASSMIGWILGSAVRTAVHENT
jgi:hypothetical protein